MIVIIFYLNIQTTMLHLAYIYIFFLYLYIYFKFYRVNICCKITKVGVKRGKREKKNIHIYNSMLTIIFIRQNM